jgi:homoserine dehydrogenase
MKAAIIGAGNIGKELHKRLLHEGWEIPFVLSSKVISLPFVDGERSVVPIEEYRRLCSGVDITFLAIPTTDDGSTAAEYIDLTLNAGIPIVTCEKGALSNHFARFENRLNQVGFSATVGGGTRLLRYAQEKVGPSVEQVHAVLNGTLNYILDRVGGNTGLGEAVDETIRLGYAEPGATSPLDVINSEAVGDVPMKAAILFNVLGLAGISMKASDVEHHPLTESHLDLLVLEASVRRYIVSLTRKPVGGDRIGGFDYTVDGWTLSAGFRNCNDNPLYRRLVHGGVNNSLLISEGEYGKDGSYVVSGPGAGASPTAASMIQDARELLGL